MSDKQGRESRKKRILENYGGVWGSSSQDFVRLAFMLFDQSADYAKNIDGNCSVYTLSGIPMLFSAIRCLMIELNSNMYSKIIIVSPEDLANSGNDIRLIINNYELPENLKNNLEYLIELRNEIIHPSHKPVGTNDNVPSYLKIIQKKGLLQSTGDSSDYIWVAQLQSHKLFEWSFEKIASMVDLLLKQHEVDEDISNDISKSYGKFREVAF